MPKGQQKILTLKDLARLKNKSKGKKVVLVGGGFDILHYGHVEFLSKARKRGDLLIVFLESDEYIKKVKKRTPIHTQKERALILAAFQCTDIIILLPYMKNDKEYSDLVETIRPTIIAVTAGDPKLEKKRIQAKSVNGELQVVSPLKSKFSSSKIIKHYASISRN